LAPGGELVPELVPVYTDDRSGSSGWTRGEAGAEISVETPVTIAAVDDSNWDGGGATPNTTGLYRIEWQSHAEPESSHAFDFCLSNIAAVP